MKKQIVLAILILLLPTVVFAKNMIKEDKMMVSITHLVRSHIEKQDIELSAKQREQLYDWMVSYVQGKYGSFVNLNAIMLVDESETKSFYDMCQKRATQLRVQGIADLP